MNNHDTSAIGWFDGDGLSSEAGDWLAEFIDGLADGSIKLFVGPLNYQDGSPYLADGEEASDHQIWYTKQLLEGMIGASSS
jgi:simple sugar transport system substrate-binding protein